jgi:hypothetical protein
MPLSDNYINEYVLTTLGAESVGVELTERDLEVCRKESLRHYNRQNPLKRRMGEVVPPQRITKYPLQPGSYNVTDVQFQNALQTMEALDSQTFNLFNNVLLTQHGYGGTSIRAEDYELTLMWRKMTGRVFSLDNDFHVDDDPQPDGSTADYGDYAPKCIYIYNGTGLDVRASWYELSVRPSDKVPVRDEEWVLEYALAHGKEILGRKRSRVKTIPMAGQQLQLDGEALLAEAREDKLRLVEDLRHRYLGEVAPIWG